MFQLLQWAIRKGSVRAEGRGGQRRPRRVPLQIEALEDRQLLSTVPYWEAPSYPITSMTDLARYAPRPTGPTTLWLNFGGASAGNLTEQIGAHFPSARDRIVSSM